VLNGQGKWLHNLLEKRVMGHSVNEAKQAICGLKIEVDKKNMNAFEQAEWKAGHDYAVEAENKWEEGGWGAVAEELVKAKTLQDALAIINRPENADLKATMKREGLEQGYKLFQKLEAEEAEAA
ncbi:MAG: hypothetical protein AAB678_01165, partial [Patescibacteria group bacterium]